MKKKLFKAPFARIKDVENEIWVSQKVLETGCSLTAVVNEAIRAARTGTKFKLDMHVPLALKKVESAKERRLKRYGSIAKTSQTAHAG